MKKLLIAAAMLAALCRVANAQTVVQNGNSTRGVQQITLVGGIHAADSTGAVLYTDGSGNLYTTEAFPLNTLSTWGVAYTDTMSWNGRSLDSTGTTMIPCANYRYINLAMKVEGANGAVGVANLVRIAVTAVFSHSSAANDTISSFAVPPFQVPLTLTAGLPIDSVGVGTVDGVLTTNTVGSAISGGNEVTVRFAPFTAIGSYDASRTCVLNYFNSGFEYVKFRFRVLTGGDKVTSQSKIKLRAVYGMRAL